MTGVEQGEENTPPRIPAMSAPVYPLLLFAAERYVEGIGLNVDEMRFVYPNENKYANLVMIMCRYSKSQTKILPPLYNFINGENSKEAKEIFKLCNTCSIKISHLEQIL